MSPVSAGEDIMWSSLKRYFGGEHPYKVLKSSADPGGGFIEDSAFLARKM